MTNRPAKTASAAARGYGAKHRRLRQIVALQVKAGAAVCARCGLPIDPLEDWDLGHVDGTNKTEYSGAEHRACNRATSAHRAHQRRKYSRRW